VGQLQKVRGADAGVGCSRGATVGDVGGSDGKGGGVGAGGGL
jgi:hypothetical protein